MALACTAPAVNGPFVGSALAFVDCQAKALGAIGFQSLAAPGSSIGALLGALLTIFIALIGYRLLLAELPDLRQLLLWTVRLGVVLMLATSWPAVRILVFDVATAAPAQLADEITRPLQLARLDGELPDQMQAISDAMDRIMTPAAPAAQSLSTGAPTQSGTPPGSSGASPTSQQPGFTQPFKIDLTTPLPAAKAIFLLTGLGTLAALHAATGLLIALLPLFACFLLFEATSGLFEGWVRAVAGASLAVLAAAIVLGIESAVLLPLLDQLTGLSDAGEPLAAGVGNVLLVTLMFAAAMLGALWAVLRATAGFGLPRSSGRTLPGGGRAELQSQPGGRPGMPMEPTMALSSPADLAPPRAAAVADALRAAERREAAAADGSLTRGRVAMLAPAHALPTLEAAPLGQGGRRYAGMRVSASAARRDQRT